jgi:hypothetical protein
MPSATPALIECLCPNLSRRPQRGSVAPASVKRETDPGRLVARRVVSHRAHKLPKESAFTRALPNGHTMLVARQAN